MQCLPHMLVHGLEGMCGMKSWLVAKCYCQVSSQMLLQNEGVGVEVADRMEQGIGCVFLLHIFSWSFILFACLSAPGTMLGVVPPR